MSEFIIRIADFIIVFISVFACGFICGIIYISDKEAKDIEKEVGLKRYPVNRFNDVGECGDICAVYPDCTCKPETIKKIRELLKNDC